MGGANAPSAQERRADRYWNPTVAAWYPDGKDDPSLTLLRFNVSDAEVWISKGSAIRLAWEVAKAKSQRHDARCRHTKHLDLN